jgi:hypothetical protein
MSFVPVVRMKAKEGGDDRAAQAVAQAGNS